MTHPVCVGGKEISNPTLVLDVKDHGSGFSSNGLCLSYGIRVVTVCCSGSRSDWLPLVVLSEQC